MIKSMTGFGRAATETPERKITAEIKSLNSKQFDLMMRNSSVLRSHDNEIRNIVSPVVTRGKADLCVTFESSAEVPALHVNRPLAKKYYEEMKSLAAELGAEHGDLFLKILQMPDVVQNGKEEQKELSEQDWEQVKQVILKALNEFDAFRKKEGKVLETELKNRIQTIQTLLKAIEPHDKKRFVSQKSRLHKLLHSNTKKGEVDENRFEQELLYYFEKLDTTEEKLRLKTHCDYFLATMKEESQGRKLGFICQEIGREINTIGSKANDAAMQKMVVQMKDELEKIKEQLMNVL